MDRRTLGMAAAGLAAAVGLGLLEAAWTTPAAPGATRPMLGSLGIAMALGAVCWRRLWWVPALGMLEELVQIFAGQLPPVWPTPAQALFQHWSAAFTPVNLYPYLTFPLLAVAGELLYRSMRRNGSNGTRHAGVECGTG